MLMRKSLLFMLVLLLLIGMGRGVGQNLVPNGDFEQYWGCPISHSQIDSCKYWTFATVPSCEYFNRCSSLSSNVGIPKNTGGIQESHSGNAYCGIITYYNEVSQNYREYIEVPLKSPLIANTCYHISFYINSADNRRLTSGNIGAYFSTTLISDSNNYYPLPFSPQFNNSATILPDTVNWLLVDGDIIAQGGERYLIIGNFNNDANTTASLINPSGWLDQVYLYIDDVSVYKCNTQVYNANAGNDINLCKGEGVELKMQYSEDYKYRWFTMDSVLLDTTNAIIVTPDSTTQYVLWINDFKYDQSYDTVTVFVDDSCNRTIYIPNIFSPNHDGQNDKLFVKGQAIESLHFLIYNRWGNLVFESNDINQGWEGTQNGKPCETGVYVYRAEVTFKNGETLSKRGDVTLVR
jgi:gliding motility-associated-like protein